MSASRVLVVALVAACAPTDADGLLVEVSTHVEPLDRLTFIVLGPDGERVPERDVPLDGALPELPADVRLDTGDRRETLTVLAWGWHEGGRVAFGAAIVEAAPDRDATVSLVLDPPPADRDGDTIPDTYDKCPDEPDVAQRDADGDGLGDACDCPNNLLDNGDFELGTAGWASGEGEITWSSVGHSGGHSLGICRRDGGGDYLSLHLDPDLATGSVPVGATYHLSAWVRNPSAGTLAVAPRLILFDASSAELDVETRTVSTLTEAWQRLPLDLPVESADAPQVQHLDLRFEAFDTSAGRCLELDDVCLTMEVPP